MSSGEGDATDSQWSCGGALATVVIEVLGETAREVSITQEPVDSANRSDSVSSICHESPDLSSAESKLGISVAEPEMTSPARSTGMVSSSTGMQVGGVPGSSAAGSTGFVRPYALDSISQSLSAAACAAALPGEVKDWPGEDGPCCSTSTSVPHSDPCRAGPLPGLSSISQSDSAITLARRNSPPDPTRIAQRAAAPAYMPLLSTLLIL